MSTVVGVAELRQEVEVTQLLLAAEQGTLSECELLESLTTSGRIHLLHQKFKIPGE